MAYDPLDWNVHLGIAQDPSAPFDPIPAGWDSSGQVVFTNQDVPPPVKEWGGLPMTAASTYDEMVKGKLLEMEQNKARDAAIRWAGANDYMRTFTALTKAGESPEKASLDAFTQNANKMFWRDPEGARKAAMEFTSARGAAGGKKIIHVGDKIIEVDAEGNHRIVYEPPAMADNLGEQTPLVDPEGKTIGMMVRTGKDRLSIVDTRPTKERATVKITDESGQEITFTASPERIEEIRNAAKEKPAAGEKGAGKTLSLIERIFGAKPQRNVVPAPASPPMISPTNPVDAFNLSTNFNRGPVETLTNKVTGVPVAVPDEMIRSEPGLTADQRRLYLMTNQLGRTNVPPPPGPTNAAERVIVISPSGKRGYIPRSELPQALKEGYRIP